MVYDVALSGYGPTGLAAASLLARRGHRVCVFERWPSLYGLPRMATIDGESARILQAAADVDTALRHSVPRKRYLFANESGDILIDHDWDKGHVCGFPFRISLHQPDIEDAMDAAARQRGAEINQGWEVCGLTQTSELATVIARERSSGTERRVQAKYAIAADGARSAVRELLGIGREAWPLRAAWLTFDATRKRSLPNFFGISPDGRVAAVFCAPGGRSHSIIPLGRNHVRFNFQTDPDTPHDGTLDRELAYRRLREVYGIGEEDVEVYRQAVYPFEGKLAETWRVGRTFLAGDAAHLMTPFLGQGGCSGLRDAINLAWKLDLVLRGVAGERLLDTYQAERKPNVRAYIEGSDKIGALAFIAEPKVPPAAQVPEVQLGPQGVVRYQGRQGRFDDVVGWGFQLLGWDCDPAAHLRADQLAFLQQIGTVICGISDRETEGFAFDAEGAYRRFFSERGIRALLVRPDFVVSGAAQDERDLPALIDALSRQLRP